MKTRSKGDCDYGSNLSVVTKPLGIEFEVKNLPSDVVRYEIVRCERTLSDSNRACLNKLDMGKVLRC